jgi:TRAP-type C4-dicarboxylate transport system substrate-binding protein
MMRKGFFALDHVWGMGFSNINTATKPIRSADDVNGIKVLAALSRQNADVLRSMGGTPTSLARDERPSAIRTRCFDGAEGSFGAVVLGGLAPYTRYVSVTAHSWNCYWTFVQPEKWRRLPKKLRDLVATELSSAVTAQRGDARESETRFRAQLQQSGVTFTEPDRDSLKARLASSGYYRRWKDEVGSAAWRALCAYSNIA